MSQFRIRPAEPEDARIISNNRNRDYKFLHTPELYSQYETTKWLQNLPSSSRRFIIEQDGTFSWVENNLAYTRLSGTIGIVRIDNINEMFRNCYIGMDIYDPYKGKGLSVPIYNYVLKYLFNDLNMHIVYLEVLDTNIRAVHVYEKIGFKYSGRFREKVVQNGLHVDSLIYSLKRDEFYAKERISNG